MIALAELVRAAWRHKRVLTDPDVAVVLDAMLSCESAERVREVASTAGGRVTVERPVDEWWTVALWTVVPADPTLPEEWTQRFVRRPIAFGRCRESRDEIRCEPLVCEREGYPHVLEVFDEFGASVITLTAPKAIYGTLLKPGDVVELGEFSLPRDLGTTRRRVLDDISRHMEQSLGPVDPGSVMGQFGQIYAERLAELWEQLDVIAKSQTLETATAADLDAYMGLASASESAGSQ